MKKIKRIIVWTGILVLTAVLFLFVWEFVVIPSRMRVLTSRTIADALRDARSVTIEEFIPANIFSGGAYTDRETVLQSIAASPNQVLLFRRTIAGFLDYGPTGSHRCFQPHHRVKIVRADGRTIRFEVCFLCSGYRFSSDNVAPEVIPLRWSA